MAEGEDGEEYGGEGEKRDREQQIDADPLGRSPEGEREFVKSD